jgi:hypothetical protein
MSTVTSRLHWQAGGGLARVGTVVSRESVPFLIAAGIVGLHIVDDNFLQPEPGTSAGDHLASGLIPFAVLAGVAAVYPRLPAGLRARQTLARTEESHEGFVARIVRRPLQRKLDGTLAGVVHHLGVEAESHDAG